MRVELVREVAIEIVTPDERANPSGGLISARA
jgi:hypothetical protein